MKYRPERGQNWLQVTLALCMALVIGCTTVQPRGGVLARESWLDRPVRQVGVPQPGAGVSGEQSPLEQPLEWEVLQKRTPQEEEAARKAELERALEQVIAVASGVERVGTWLQFRYWVEQGAVTLVGYRAWEGSGGRAGPVVEGQKMLREVRLGLTAYGSNAPGLVVLTLERQQQAWRVGVERPGGARPAEARALAVRQQAVRQENYLEAYDLAGRLLEALRLPSGGKATQEVRIKLEDGRVLEAQVVLQERNQGGTGQGEVTYAGIGEITWLLLALGEGIGPRQAVMRLRVDPVAGAQRARVWVESAEVQSSPMQQVEDEEFAAEYRKVHEETLRLWREELEEGAEWVVRAGVEELAMWYVGGIAAKGAGVLAELTLPVVRGVLGRGRAAATRWLRTNILRLPAESKLNFERLWTKLQLEGEAALTAQERNTLRKVMSELDLIVRQPLDNTAKGQLRKAARSYYEKFHPELEDLVRQEWVYPVHHRRPLEYAHLFPGEDINDPQNLALVYVGVHQRISAIWSKLRKANPNPTAEEVRLAAKEIDECFKQWYDKVADTSDRSAFESYLAYTESVALERLQRIFPGL